MAHRLAEGAEVHRASDPAGRLLEAPAQVAGPGAQGEKRAIQLHLGAREMARDVANLLVIGEEERMVGGRRLGSAAAAKPWRSSIVRFADGL